MSTQSKICKKLVFGITTKPHTQNPAQVNDRQFSFIYGIATEGLNDFEIAISDLNVGDTFELPLSGVDVRSYMDHVFLMFCKQTGLVEFDRSMSLTFALCEISTPAPAEIVSAMAEVQHLGSCSDGCDCGCH